MEIINGSVREFVRSTAGALIGLIIDGGFEVRFPVEKSPLVVPIISIGSRVEIEGFADDGISSSVCLNASVVKNLDSGCSATLQDVFPPQKPEVSPLQSPAPSAAIPLASHRSASPAPDEDVSTSGGPQDRLLNLGWKRVSSTIDLLVSEPIHPRNRKAASPLDVDRDEATRSIEQAYDALHRTQALLAYLKIVGLRGPDAGQLLNESKHTYEQALSHFQHREFSVACEFASASTDLANAVEILIIRTLRADSNYPTLVSLPPRHATRRSDVEQTENDLEGVATTLLRLRWFLKNGTLPAEDREQVRRLVSWTEDFYEECKKLSQTGASEDALKMAEAAARAGQSAEHVCKQSYMFHERTVNGSARPGSISFK